MTFTLPELLTRFPSTPDRPAFFFRSTPYSYGWLRSRSDSLGHALAERIRPGEKVALYAPNCPDFVVSYFAILKAGGVVIPINPLLTPNEVNYITTNGECSLLLTHPSVEKKASDLLRLREDFSVWTMETPEWMALRERETPPLICPVDDPHRQSAAILYTSGTTGKPKGAVLSHRNLLADVQGVAEALKINQDDRFLTVLPLFHSFGQTVGMLAPLWVNASFVLAPRFTPEESVSLIQEHGCTLFSAVPAMFQSLALLPQETLKHYDTSSLRFCIAGGAPLPIDLIDRFEEKYGITVYEGDGPTECSPVTSVNPVGGKRKKGTIGLPIRGVEMRIVDEKGQELPPLTPGEIAVRGETVMLGYFNNEKATRESFLPGGWYLTGDIGTRDEEGYFTIVDRKKDMIIINGLNVYPREVEEEIYRLPSIREAAVVGTPHPLHGEVPVAFLVLKSGEVPDHRKVFAYLRNNLAEFKIPRRLYFVDELPRTATGKVAKNILRERAK